MGLFRFFPIFYMGSGPLIFSKSLPEKPILLDSKMDDNVIINPVSYRTTDGTGINGFSKLYVKIVLSNFNV
jgi:hypothetical protein